MNYDVIGMYEAGFVAQAKNHAAREVSKLHVLRGGSVGCVTAPGECIGNPQEALARYMGYELPKDPISNFYFAAGFANEEIWQKNLRDSGQKILTDAEDKIETTIAGYKWSGSPDIRLLDGDGRPYLGIELKAVCSSSTASDIFIYDKPKTKHVAQAAIYSYMLDIPYKLVYTSYGVYYPYSAVSRETKVWKVEPGIREYDIDAPKNGPIRVRISGRWEDTVLSVQGILDYYKAVGDMFTNKNLDTLQPRNLDIFGKSAAYKGKDELHYDEFYQKIGVPDSWDTFIRRLDTHCNRIGT
jgi:hypothetical protein